MQILALCGSLRAASLNAALLRTIARLAPPHITVTLCPHIATLPLFNPDLDAPYATEPPPPVPAFRQQIKQADALIIASPEYAHGVTGVIKNALDWLVSYEPVVGKPVALLNASPRAHHSDDALREILKTMSMEVIEEASITVPLAGANLGEENILCNRSITIALKGMFHAFLTENIRQQDLLKLSDDPQNSDA